LVQNMSGSGLVQNMSGSGLVQNMSGSGLVAIEPENRNILTLSIKGKKQTYSLQRGLFQI